MLVAMSFRSAAEDRSYHVNGWDNVQVPVAYKNAYQSVPAFWQVPDICSE